MKTNYLFLSLTIGALLLGSCEADDTADIVINNTDNSVTNNNGSTSNPDPEDPTGENVNLEGSYDENLTLDAANTYTLTGPLIMNEGSRLVIPAGTIIQAQSGDGAGTYIAISQGATINAQGTAENPIIMTSQATSPAAGDWGGLIILGRAPINSALPGATATSEIGNLNYGGNNASDSSGIISYVRVEYSGGKASSSNENNGFSFYGVGSGTTVDHIQAFIGADDGVEFFGGTVNASFVSVIGVEDDSVDWTEGWTGTITDVYIRQLEGLFDKGIEADGFNSEIGNLSDPLYFSSPTLTNVTIIGIGSNGKDGDGLSNRAVNLRVGTRATFDNVSITGYATGFDIDGDSGASPTGEGIVDGDTSISNITFEDVTLRLKNDTGVEFGEDDLFSGIGEGSGTDYADWGADWTVE